MACFEHINVQLVEKYAAMYENRTSSLNYHVNAKWGSLSIKWDSLGPTPWGQSSAPPMSYIVWCRNIYISL